jgi:hypothetical protein
MAMSYTTLVGAKTLAGSIKRATNYAELDSEVILEQAQTFLYSTLRVREMKSLWNPAMVVGDYYKALPSDWLDPISGRFSDTSNLYYFSTLETELMMRRCYDSSNVLVSGTPIWWAIFDERIQFDAKFDTARTLNILYFKIPTALSGSNETNFVTTRYPHLLQQACKVQAHAFMKSWNAYNTEFPLLIELISRANVESDLTYRGADYDQG